MTNLAGRYRGRWQRRVRDEKIKLPQRLCSNFRKGWAYAVLGEDHLSVYSSPPAEAYVGIVYANGYLRIPFRVLSASGIEKEAVVVKMPTCAEIWDPQRLLDFDNKTEPELQRLLKKFTRVFPKNL